MRKKYRFHRVVLAIVLAILYCGNSALAQDVSSPNVNNSASAPRSETEFDSDSMMPSDSHADGQNLETDDENAFDIAEDTDEDDICVPAMALDDSQDDDIGDGQSDVDENAENDIYSDVARLKLPNPEYYVENIHITGNSHTSRERILHIMQIDDIDELRKNPMTVEELEDCRIRLAVSGLFEHVEMKLVPGSMRSHLRIELSVEERSPVQINRYFIGTDSKSAYWHGLDVSWIGAFSPLHRMRMIYAATTESDYTLDLNYFVPSIGGVPVSLFAGIHTMNGHEGVFGPNFNAEGERESDYAYLDDLSFRRHGASLGMGFAATENFRFFLRTTYVRLHRHNRVGVLDDNLDVYLKKGWSSLFNAMLMVVFDTRSGHDMRNDGHALNLSVGGTFKTKASQYGYVKLVFMHQSNVPLGSPSHILRIDTFLGGLWGDAPFFEKFFYNDFYDLAPSRIGMLNPAERGAFDIFKTGTKGLSYEDFLARLSLSYAWQPIPQKIEFFGLVSAIWANSSRVRQIRLANKSSAKRDVFPVDLSFNAGVRWRTNYGLFSFTLAHIFNLIPR